MTIAGDLDYAHARLCARFGERPDELAWRSIEPIRSLPALLDTARGLPFRCWIEAITASATPHEIEAALVSRRRALVAEVAQWMPQAWQAAVEWAGVAAELPVLEHLSRGGEAQPWMREDRLYAPLCSDGPRQPACGLFLPLAAGWRRADGLFRAWRAEWMRRLPGEGAHPTLLDELARTLASQRMLASTFSAETTLRRSALAARLAILFRRATGDPAAAFIFLALSALDLERLRGELLRRAVFPSFGLGA
jgi:hypothetical protein